MDANIEPKRPTPRIQIVESDSPDGPWTPVPETAYQVQVLDTDLARMDNRVLDEMMPVDHRTVLGTLGGIPEMLGFERLKIVQKHLGERCFLRDVRNWLRKHNIDGRDINWTDFCALLTEQSDRTEERPKSSASPTDDHLEVLYVLEERETLSTVATICKALKAKGIIRAPSTIKAIVRDLCDWKFADRPRQRKGARITPCGKAYLHP